MEVSPEASPLIELKNLTAGYGSNTVLKDISLAIEAGEFLGIIGPNGSGKSTLLHCISGIHELESGDIRLTRKGYSEFTRKEMAKMIAVVEAEEAMTFQYSVGELVEMGRLPYLKRFETLKENDRRAIELALDTLQLTDLQRRPINELSSGERQRVFFARALAQETKILLLDEPTAHLDLQHQIDSFQLMHQLNRDCGQTIVCISHDINLAAEFCSRLIVLENGRIKGDGPPETVLTNELIQDTFGQSFQLGTHPKSGRPYILHPSRTE